MTERRNKGRRPTMDSIRITVGETGMRCAVRNLSSSGCMVECTELVAEVGTPVKVALLPGHEAKGEVAWQLGHSIGIFFLEPVSPHVVRLFALDDWVLRGDWAAGRLSTPDSESSTE